MICPICNSALRVPPRIKTLSDPVVPVLSPLQCAIGPVLLPDPVLLAVVVVESPQQCAIRVVPLPEPVQCAVVVVSSPLQCAI